MSDWWIRKVEPAAVTVEASVSSHAHSSPSAAVDSAAADADYPNNDTVEPSPSHSTATPVAVAAAGRPMAVPLSPATVSRKDEAATLPPADDEETTESAEEEQQPQQSVQQQSQPDEEDEELTAVEDDSEHDILTLDDVIAPSASLSTSHPPLAPAAASQDKSLLADLTIAQLSPVKPVNTTSHSHSAQPLLHSNHSAVGPHISNALDEFINQQLQQQPQHSRQLQLINQPTSNTSTATGHTHSHTAEDSSPFAIRRAAPAQRNTATTTTATTATPTTGSVRQSPAARRSFGLTLGLSIQAAIEGLHTDSSQQSSAGREDENDEDSEYEEDEEAVGENDSPASAERQSAAEDESDDNRSPASMSFDGRSRRKSDTFRSSLMRMRRVSRRDSRHNKDREESKEDNTQQPDGAQYEHKEDSDEGEGEGASSDSGSSSNKQPPLTSAAEAESGSVRLAAAVSVAGAGSTHDGLPTFHFNDSHNEQEEGGDERPDDEDESLNTAAYESNSDNAADKHSTVGVGGKGAAGVRGGVDVEAEADEQQPGAATAVTQTEKDKVNTAEEEEQRQRTMQREREVEEEREAERMKEEGRRAAVQVEENRRKKEEEEAQRLKERQEEERKEADRQRRKREAEKAKADKTEKEERDRALTAAAAMAAAVAAKSAVSPPVQSASASSRPAATATSSSSNFPPEPATIGVWKSSRRSAMQLLVVELTNATFLQPTHNTQQPHLPLHVARILLRAITHWQLLPAATSSTGQSASHSAASFRSAFSSSTLAVNQTSFRFLPSSARAKSIDSSVAVFPHPLPAFTSLSAAPHFTVPPAAPQDDSQQHNSESTAQLTPLDRSMVLAALLYGLHTAVHTAAREDDTPHICALFTIVAQLRTLLAEHNSNAAATAVHDSSRAASARLTSSAVAISSHAAAGTTLSSSSLSPVLDRVYALPFMSNSPLVPSSPPAFDPLLPPPFTSISAAQWLNVQLLDLQALCHQLVVQAVMSAWQTSLAPLDDVWLEEDGGGARSGVLSSYCSSYQQFDSMCEQSDWSVVQRQSVLSCCLHWLVNQLFNSALSLPNLTLDTGLRVKQCCSALSDFARRLLGDSFGSSVAALITPLQELAMCLLMDKVNTTLDEMRMLAPSLPLIALHHLLFVFMQSEDNEEDSVSPQLLQQVATQLAAEQSSGQAADKQEAATKPTHIVLMLDFANQTPAALSINAASVQWQWPDALLHSPALSFVTQPQGET